MVTAVVLAVAGGAVGVTLALTGDGDEVAAPTVSIPFPPAGTDSSTTSTPVTPPAGGGTPPGAESGVFVRPKAATECTAMAAEITAAFQQWIDVAAGLPLGDQQRWVDDFEPPPGEEEFHAQFEAWGESMGDRVEALGCSPEVFADAARAVSGTGPIIDMLVRIGSQQTDAAAATTAVTTTAVTTTQPSAREVPDLTGLTFEVARQTASASGFDLREGQDIPLWSGDPLIGLVYRTEPREGAAHDPGEPLWAEIGFDAGVRIGVHPNDLANATCEPIGNELLPDTVELLTGAFGGGRLQCQGTTTAPAYSPIYVWESWTQGWYPVEGLDAIEFTLDGEYMEPGRIAEWRGGVFVVSAFFSHAGLDPGEHFIEAIWYIDGAPALVSTALVEAE